MSQSRPRLGAVAALAMAAVLTLTACQSDDLPGASALGGDPSPSASESVPPLKLVSSIAKGAKDVPVDRELSVRATGGSIESVQVTSPAGKVPGEVQADGTRWAASGRLEPGTSYTMTTVAERSDGTRVTRTARFSTQALTLDQQTYPSVAPLAGETVGVGMPVIVTFDLPVTDKATFEKHMEVTSSPSQPGAWHWISDTEAHWRPKSYWKAGTDVHVDVDINSVPAGKGIYGQESRELDFHVGDAHIYRVNAQTHQMKVFSNGKLLRTLPITTGKPGFTTRSGVKVIIEKFDVKRMNSETVGIPAGSADSYDIDDVQWAMRVTYSGEFIHAAPWSVGSQGYANVSHGCTGMSTANAAWLYAMSRRGDVVEYTGTDRPMTLTNGYGDWNESFRQYRQGSALS
ncbi:L,D-transpeptidase [Nocardioides sp. T2.26MG-1]|uniref:L,D-transpeptidase n=1 Tax=Nocardioides sp. T2.26MG-1 TaxID=3041166 RepID=UPI00247772F8|nr:Ig-like domain-containing protein [Nocardioides sp. T2.26MG-1]CAI9419624.1 L,D-transpeptidase 2 [Nocardioides sp. T2.26MG-1]